VNSQLTELKSNLKETFNFVLAKLETLLAFTEFGMEEILRLSSVDNLNLISLKIVDFLNTFRK